jgi:hypothetical protein
MEENESFVAVGREQSLDQYYTPTKGLDAAIMLALFQYSNNLFSS